jgi:hypothetical protein
VKPLAAIALVVLATGFSARLSFYGHGWMMGDFKTFYCAARVVLEHENPYNAVPLGQCELLSVPRPLYLPKPGLVLPAPLPGYAIAGFLPFASMPFVVAVLAWFVALSAATVAAIVILARMGAGDVWTIAVALAVPVVAISFVLGQVVPIAIFGVTLAAYAARRGATFASTAMLGCGLLLAFIEPQVGVAVALASALLARRFAAAAALVVGVLVVISLVTVGLRENVLYLREVLPAQLLAEVPVYFQYSASWIAAHLGASAAQAVALGRWQWIAMLGATAFIARSDLAKQHPEAAILGASAVAVTGGPYLHLQHVALALPAALWLASLKRRESKFSAAVVVALALPLLQFFLIAGRTPIVFVLAMFLFVAGWLGTVYGGSLRYGIAACAVSACAILVTAAVFMMTGFGLPSPVAGGSIPSQIPQASWAHFAAAHYSVSSAAVWLVKIPTWFGLAGTVACLVAVAWGYGKQRQLFGAAINAA